MTSPSIEESLAKAERALDSGSNLSGTGFWSVVSTVKRHPELADRYAERIAAIDEQAHRQWAVLVIPLWLGTPLALVAVLIGLALVWWAFVLSGTGAVVAFFVGTGVLLGSTHGLGHLVVGRLLGMRFCYWFVGEVKAPQPGVKLDYATYLRTPPRRRAWMHASGALTTKTIPFLLIGAALAADLPGWVPLVIAAMGTAMIVTDVLWSTKASDWKKFQREMEFAQGS